MVFGRTPASATGSAACWPIFRWLPLEAAALPVGFEQLLGMFAGGFGELGTAQHPGNFFSPLLAGDATDAGLRSLAGSLFLDEVVLIGKGRNLWQMGHAKDLVGMR